MINYSGGAFGFRILLRLHGSAVAKSLTPALLSSVIYALLAQFTNIEEGEIFDHPYPMGALVSAFSFLLVFRANFSYHRYWEALTAIHSMHSKWLDFATDVAAFHYQSDRYDDRKPPAFGKFPNVKSITRERERRDDIMTFEELQDHIEDTTRNADRNDNRGWRHKFEFFKRRRQRDPRINHRADSKNINDPDQRAKQKKSKSTFNEEFDCNGNPFSTFTTIARERMNWESNAELSAPPLFLEEVAHLLSLMSAVALSTLRNDLEEAESPLIEFFPNAPWPNVDPDDYGADVRREWTQSSYSSASLVRYIFGLSRTDAARTLYNAARPFRVIGNVSDAEIELLQAARGPLSKVALCAMWLQEFISREHLSGSTGKVAPPIISRIYQYISEGMLGYNQARKTAYIPFPFPHAQITTLFVLVIVVFMPILMLSFLSNQVFGFALNLFTVMCFTGLHEVARELESPFQNVPNDIPLNNFQAQFNESLMVMFFGYHPDAYWTPKEESVQFKNM